MATPLRERSTGGVDSVTLSPTDARGDEPLEQTLAELGADPDHGLTSAEAASRLERFGPNAIQEVEEPVWQQLARRFWGPIPWMIEAAAILSAVVGRWEDFAIILVMLAANAGIDFAQAHRAGNALQALKAELASQSRVLRDGAWSTVVSDELVPGDVARLSIGDIVPADARLVDGDYVSIDQSALTGESLPVTKQRGDIAYSGTVVRQGEMSAVVVNTGANTNFHTVVSLVADAEAGQRSHFQRMVVRVGDFLIALTALLVIIIVLVGLARGQDFLELTRFSMVLTVASIPVALPAVLSVTMAVGASELAKRRAIVSRLVAIEELAGVDVLCSDKTGTLTKNEMTVADPVVFEGHTTTELFTLAVLASRRETGDPIEAPIFAYADEHLPDGELAGYEVTRFVPFDPVRKRTEADVVRGDDHFVAMKGAAQIILDLADPGPEVSHAVERSVDELASKGYRTLAVARASGDDVELVGLVPLFDPPRDDSKEVIAAMGDSGVSVKMITGDNLAIASEIGSALGLSGRAVHAGELRAGGSDVLAELARIIARVTYNRLADDADEAAAQGFADDVAREVAAAFATEDTSPEFIRSHESEIVAVVDGAEIFAEVVPEDKYLIVDTLQQSGHIVAMTGDGVNDAPALKKADAGIAVSNATDAARAAADIVLTEPGLDVISEAIRLARVTFERMKSYATFRIAETIRVIVFMFLAIVVFDFFPVTALMIVILALLNDIPILAIAYDNTAVDRRPVRWNMPTMLTTATALGLAGVVSSFLLFYILVELDYPTELIQSMFFAKLVVAGHGTIYNTRAEGWFWQRPYPSRTLFLATFSTRVIGTLIAVYGIFITSIGWNRALLMWAYALVWFVVNDVVKVLTHRALHERGRYT